MDDLTKLQRQYDSALNDLEKYSVSCSEREATFKNLDSTTKSMLAVQYNIFQSTAGTQKDREMRALSSQAYLTHLLALGEVRHEFLAQRALKEVAQAKCEYCRTQISTERAKIGLR